MKNRQKNGYSLIEFMIAIAISGILILAISSLASSMNQLLKRSENVGHADLMASTLQTTLAYPGVCQYNLKLPNFAALTFNTANAAAVINVTTIQIPTGVTFAPFLAVDQNIGKTFWLKQMRIRNFARIASSNIYKADFEVSFSQDGPGIPAITQPEFRMIPIYLTTTTTGVIATITNCTMGPPTAAPPVAGEYFPGWPNVILCDGAAWRINVPGRYLCHEGGATSSRSGQISYNLGSKTYVTGSYDNETTLWCGATCGVCCSQSIQQLIANGYTR